MEATISKVIKLKSYITYFNLLQVSEEDVKKFERWQKRVAVTLDDRELSETKFIIAVESNYKVCQKKVDSLLNNKKMIAPRVKIQAKSKNSSSRALK